MTSLVQPATFISAIPATEWQAHIQAAAHEVFQIMVGAELTVLSVEPEREFPDHTAMVGLAGTLCGVISVRCSSNTAVIVASKMLGISPDEAAEQSKDALGEVCNMIAGAFKNQIPQLESGCMLSVPTVISGADYELQSLGQGERIRCDFMMAAQCISVMLETRPMKHSQKVTIHSVV